jgi:signal transduction histidine kinase
MSGQLFFITDTANKILTFLTIIIAGCLSVILFRNLKKESNQRVQIEKLNIELQRLSSQRESMVHLINHKVKGSFTRSKYIFAGILDGTFGDANEEIKKIARQGIESDDTGVKTIDLVLNAANLQKGTVKYDLKSIDLKEIILKIIANKQAPIETKGLKLESNVGEGSFMVLGDAVWLKEAFDNLIENSMRYTKEGSITIGLDRKQDKIIFSVKDTGIGITEEDKANLFTEGGRGKDSIKVNVDSTGYGLYSVKLIIESHKGSVWAESDGPGKGSTFFIELPALG